MKPKTWLLGWLAAALLILIPSAVTVYTVDPYFHYHKPDPEKYSYTLDNERAQNNGILRHFDYDALITGTSMTENFKTSEADRIFGTQTVKVSFMGGTYKEINDNIAKAFSYNSDLKLIIRGLDMMRFTDDPDLIRTDLGTYPEYLYDDDPFNDIEYLLNKDVLLGRIIPAMQEEAGITSFDDYGRWHDLFPFGRKTVCPNGINPYRPETQEHLSEAEKEILRQNITKNVTDLADAHPEAQFLYFYTPYSIAWWNEIAGKGLLEKQLEAEQEATRLIVSHPNIQLYSLNLRSDIITDLNHYKDNQHYADWINSLLLRYMKEGTCRITPDNCEAYLKQEADFFRTYDYTSLNTQEDYTEDLYAAALLNREITKQEPVDLLKAEGITRDVRNAETDGETLLCTGTLQRDSSEEISEYLKGDDYAGMRMKLYLDEGHRFLTFSGRKITNQGQPTVCVYDSEGNLAASHFGSFIHIDYRKHMYFLDLKDLKGEITILFHGGFTDMTGSLYSSYEFSDIILY